MKFFIEFILFLLIFTGCATKTEVFINDVNNKLGEKVTIYEGGTIASDAKGDVTVVQQFNGRTTVKFADAYREKKLFYLGFTDPVMHILYREYKQGNEKPFVDEVKKFNVDDSHFLQIKGYYLIIDELDTKSATFLLVDASTFEYEKRKYYSK